MKKLLLVPVLAATALVPMAQADNTATTTLGVSAFIVESLSISESTSLLFADHVRPASGASNTNQTLSCDSGGTKTLTYGAGANPYAHGVSSASSANTSSQNYINGIAGATVTGRCGKLDVTGQSDTYYAISVTNPISTAGTPTASISCTSDNNIDSSGEDTIWCGGTLSVAHDSQSSTLAAAITVTYD